MGGGSSCGEEGLTGLEGDITQVTGSSDNQAPKDEPGDEREAMVETMSCSPQIFACLDRRLPESLTAQLQKPQEGGASSYLEF